MKMSIEWHRKCLKNRKSHNEREIDCAQRTMDAALQGINSTAAYEKQIETAEAMGKDGFDSERFMKKVKK